MARTRSSAAAAGIPAARFWSYVDRAGGRTACWPWRGGRNWKGYGKCRDHGSDRQAHRVAFELAAGTRLLPGLQLDHLCRNRACVNPAHLQLVTCGENIRRGWAARRAARPTGAGAPDAAGVAC